MKISSIFTNTNIYNKSLNNAQKLEQPKKENDNFDVSTQARDIQMVLKAISDTSDIREDKVNDIMERIKKGNYNVSSEEIANKILSDF